MSNVFPSREFDGMKCPCFFVCFITAEKCALRCQKRRASVQINGSVVSGFYVRPTVVHTGPFFEFWYLSVGIIIPARAGKKGKQHVLSDQAPSTRVESRLSGERGLSLATVFRFQSKSRHTARTVPQGFSLTFPASASTNPATSHMSMAATA